MNAAALTALADQLTAAVRDATGDQHRRAAHHGLPFLPLPEDNPRMDDWIDAQIRILMEALTGETARLCRHITASALASAPTVLYGAAWAPGQLACRSTLHADPIEDDTCDRCRQTAGALHAGMVQTGVLLLAFGLCPGCAQHTGLTNLPTHGRS
ncbi:hypothetical protein [Acrocarpospora sp. B8E8]|uniref:hypothetical protein n=1 Tax=Acrocarpospora sp. B8E8 TaxID=3153572 RepID=UPI00325DDC18